MRIAVYGGSFNPPHMGHALVAAWVRWTDLADEVWLTPTFAHAFHKSLAPWSDRLEWCEALAEVLGAGARVCPVEAELSPPTYTIHTLDHLRAAHPEHRFRLVLGADNLADTPKWRQWERIAAEYAPIVVGREGYPVPEGAMVFPGVSSTEVRRRLALGLPVDHLVPAGVLGRLNDYFGPVATQP